MFIVSGTKIYEGHVDPELQVHREVKLIRKSDGSYQLNRLTSGIPHKPARYSLCNKHELIAQFGGSTKSVQRASEDKE